MQTENSIPEFEANKEYPIGGFFKIRKEVFKVVKSVDNGFSLCCACDLVEGKKHCLQTLCGYLERDDAIPVCFILYDELED